VAVDALAPPAAAWASGLRRAASRPRGDSGRRTSRRINVRAAGFLPPCPAGKSAGRVVRRRQPGTDDPPPRPGGPVSPLCRERALISQNRAPASAPRRYPPELRRPENGASRDSRAGRADGPTIRGDGLQPPARVTARRGRSEVQPGVSPQPFETAGSARLAQPPTTRRNGEPSGRVIARSPWRSIQPGQHNRRARFGPRASLSVTSVMTARRAHGPATSVQGRKPVTFFTTRPPAFKKTVATTGQPQ